MQSFAAAHLSQSKPQKTIETQLVFLSLPPIAYLRLPGVGDVEATCISTGKLDPVFIPAHVERSADSDGGFS